MIPRLSLTLVALCLPVGMALYYLGYAWAAKVTFIVLCAALVLAFSYVLLVAIWDDYL
jgi:hypothetical protein